MIGDAMTPFYPPFYPVLPRFSFEIAIFEVKFEVTVAFFWSNKPLYFRSKIGGDITVFEVPVFEITYLYQFYPFCQ